jgi:hypothetical protein
MTDLPAVVDPKSAVKGLLGDPDWMQRTGLGGTLNATALLIALAFARSPWFIPGAMAVSSVVSGYLVRYAKKMQEDPASKLPAWNAWGDLVFGGLTWMAVQFAWSVLAAIPITTSIIMGSIGVSSYPNNIPAVTTFIATIGFTCLFSGLGLHFLLSYLMLNFAAEEKLAAAFNLRRLVKYFLERPKAMLTAWMLAVELQLLAIVIPSVTVIGICMVPYTLFAAQLVGVSLMAQAWSSAAEAEKYTKVPEKS